MPSAGRGYWRMLVVSKAVLKVKVENMEAEVKVKLVPRPNYLGFFVFWLRPG